MWALLLIHVKKVRGESISPGLARNAVLALPSPAWPP